MRKPLISSLGSPNAHVVPVGLATSLKTTEALDESTSTYNYLTPHSVRVRANRNPLHDVSSLRRRGQDAPVDFQEWCLGAVMDLLDSHRTFHPSHVPMPVEGREAAHGFAESW